jgi:hypothetical protein
MELERALASWGLRLHFVTIQRLPDDDEDMRDFGASLLGRDGELVEPAVVLEIPSTLYALQYAPRMRRLEKRVQDGIARQVVDVLRERHLKAMLESFAKNMNFQIDHDKRKGDPNRFHMVTLGELGAALRAIGVTG